MSKGRGGGQNFGDFLFAFQHLWGQAPEISENIPFII